MDRRALLGLLVTGLALPGALPASAGKRPTSNTPDLTGVWTNAWYTHLERPAGFKGLAATPAEVAAFMAPRKAHGGEVVDNPQDVLGQNASEFPDNGPGLAPIRGELRTSWIVEPADGKIPWKKDLPPSVRAFGQPSANFDNPEARDQEERCLINPGTAAPILNDHDANLVQLVQTGSARAGGWLAIFGEKNHQVRVVRILPSGATAAGGAAAAPDPRAAGITDWLGASVGRWEGETLVVETAAFRPGLTMVTRQLLVSDKARVTERFTRTRSGPAPGEIAYGFEVTDETLYSAPIRGEMVFRPAEGRIFEYACHEGNYGMANILAGARAAPPGAKAAEAKGAEAKGK